MYILHIFAFAYLLHSSMHACTACDPACDEGLMRCFEMGPNDYCNFYHNSMCVDECPSPFIPNTDNECVCPVGTTGQDCSEGES